MALSISCFVRDGHSRGSVRVLSSVVLLATSGVGGVGKKTSIKTSAFSLSDWYRFPPTTSSRTSIAALDSLA